MTPGLFVHNTVYTLLHWNALFIKIPQHSWCFTQPLPCFKTCILLTYSNELLHAFFVGTNYIFMLFIISDISGNTKWQALVSAILQVCYKVTGVVSPVVTNSSPEGNLCGDGKCVYTLFSYIIYVRTNVVEIHFKPRLICASQSAVSLYPRLNTGLNFTHLARWVNFLNGRLTSIQNRRQQSGNIQTPMLLNEFFLACELLFLLR